MVTKFVNSEPVPEVSQLLALGFLSGVVGGMSEADSKLNFRVTLHRLMSRAGSSYLQQICGYLSTTEYSAGVAGRIFPVNYGIMGKACESGKIWRTKHYDSVGDLETDLVLDMVDTHDSRSISAVAKSWLAIPIRNQNGQSVLVFFADSSELNFFADDARVQRIVDMCGGFARVLNMLEKRPMVRARNFPLQQGKAVLGDDTAYPRIHEEFLAATPLAEIAVESFNFEVSAA